MFEKEIKYLTEIVKARLSQNGEKLETIFRLEFSSAEDKQIWVATLGIGKPETCAWLNFEGKGMLIQDALDELSSNVIVHNPLPSEMG